VNGEVPLMRGRMNEYCRGYARSDEEALKMLAVPTEDLPRNSSVPIFKNEQEKELLRSMKADIANESIEYDGV
jgi:hypothetical protein